MEKSHTPPILSPFQRLLAIASKVVLERKKNIVFGESNSPLSFSFNCCIVSWHRGIHKIDRPTPKLLYVHIGVCSMYGERNAYLVTEQFSPHSCGERAKISFIRRIYMNVFDRNRSHFILVHAYIHVYAK